MDDRAPVFRGSLGSKTVWPLCGQHFASNLILFLGWTSLFPQVKQQYGLTGMEAILFGAAQMLAWMGSLMPFLILAAAIASWKWIEPERALEVEG